MKRHIIRTIVSTLTLTVFTCTLAGCSSKARQDESSSSAVTESTAQETQTDVTESIAGETQPVTADINIAVMTGPTAIGLVKVMKDNEDGVAANNYNFRFTPHFPNYFRCSIQKYSNAFFIPYLI